MPILSCFHSCWNVSTHQTQCTVWFNSPICTSPWPFCQQILCHQALSIFLENHMMVLFLFGETNLRFYTFLISDYKTNKSAIITRCSNFNTKKILKSYQTEIMDKVDNVLWTEFNIFIANVIMFRWWEKNVELIFWEEVDSIFWWTPDTTCRCSIWICNAILQNSPTINMCFTKIVYKTYYQVLGCLSTRFWLDLGLLLYSDSISSNHFWTTAR